MKNTFCIYGSYEDFDDEIEEINKELQKHDAEFVKPQLGGGSIEENILELFMTTASSISLNAIYDIIKTFVLYCYHKHCRVSKERNVKSVVIIKHRKTPDEEYSTIEMENCSDEVMIAALDKVFNRNDNNE